MQVKFSGLFSTQRGKQRITFIPESQTELGESKAERVYKTGVNCKQPAQSEQ